MTDTLHFPGWPKGMDNIHTAEELCVVDGGDNKTITGPLRDALNVDILDTGRPTRRKGYTLSIAGDAHSLWSDGVTALANLDGDLVILNDNGTTTVMHADIGSRTVHYTTDTREIFYSNGVVTGKIVNRLRREWGVEVPASPPTIAGTSGVLFPGTYQVACTFQSIYDEEGGAVRSDSITLSAAGGLTIVAPTATSAEVDTCIIYLTQPNGSTFYRVAEVAPGATVSIVQEPLYTSALKTLHMQKMIAGEFIEHFRGYIYAVVDNIVWYSQPYNYGLYLPSEDYMMFGDTVDMVKSVTDGIYIASSATYFYGGNTPHDFSPIEVMPAGVARGSASNFPNSKDILWYSARGLVVGSNGGQIKNVQQGLVRPAPVLEGSTLIREQDSRVQFLGIGRDAPYVSPLAVSDFWETEIIRGN